MVFAFAILDKVEYTNKMMEEWVSRKVNCSCHRKNNQNDNMMITRAPYILVLLEKFYFKIDTLCDSAFVSDKTSRFGDK